MYNDYVNRITIIDIDNHKYIDSYISSSHHRTREILDRFEYKGGFICNDSYFPDSSIYAIKCESFVKPTKTPDYERR